MPATGKHRRSSRRLSRGLAVATTGGAVVALPLLGAAGAHAATPAAAPQKAETTYSVAAGDTLAKIARDHHVSGGWQKLYEANHKAVGSDPAKIKPGMELNLVVASAAKAPATGSTQSGSGWQAPVKASIGTGYQASGGSWSSGHHTGIDFLVGSGTSVKAAAAGTVVAAGDGGAYGNQVVVHHADGHYTQYGHLSSISVSVGQQVSEGQQIALSGATGNVTGPHLHFEVRTGPDYGSDINPLDFLHQHGVSA
ncbi:M23 family metallopeptidase [Streptomyces tsukubensis]|uniref:Peptidase M23 n=1 Tax=Streptomyces tsukubensis TaxID=83656 RepID=A0A1V4AED8_9ACTN|nr:LysM peptidoglycan-binding domain-containing M23 family metallopeptidase [Streptomyces tsukubensis]OON81856.1 peptidase M23 [Streptomyces tsukubensis]QFR96644.1 peptidoglycan DD-metalloendopeptidase family protein [Streptomyces tsukubensis]